MSLPPLTHHEILELVAPLSRRGRRVDLDASDRIARRLAFRPIEHPAAGPAGTDAAEALPALREDLQLEHLFQRLFRLTRVLTPPSGPPARLVAEGPDPGALLALIEAVPPSRQLRVGPGFALSHHHHIDAPEAEGAEAPLCLVESRAQARGLALTLRMPMVKRRPADLELQAEGDGRGGRGGLIALPEDLLAVLGWDWAPLKRVDEGQWRSKLRLRGGEPSRSRGAEAKAERAARHLAQILAEPPPRFHERFALQRWGAAARRLLPVMTAVAIVVVALVVPADYVRSRPVLMLLLMNAPVVLIGLAFTLQEMARIEIPPLPRPAAERAWRLGEEVR